MNNNDIDLEHLYVPLYNESEYKAYINQEIARRKLPSLKDSLDEKFGNKKKKRRVIIDRLVILALICIATILAIIAGYERTHHLAYKNAAITYCEMIYVDDSLECGFLK